MTESCLLHTPPANAAAQVSQVTRMSSRSSVPPLSEPQSSGEAGLQSGVDTWGHLCTRPPFTGDNTEAQEGLRAY